MCSEMNKREKKPPCSYLLVDQEAPANVNTVFGNEPIGSILSYQLKDLKEDAVLFSIDRPPDQAVLFVQPHPSQTKLVPRDCTASREEQRNSLLILNGLLSEN